VSGCIINQLNWYNVNSCSSCR